MFPLHFSQEFENQLRAVYAERVAQAIQNLPETTMDNDQIKLLVHAAYVTCEKYLCDLIALNLQEAELDNPIFREYSELMRKLNAYVGTICARSHKIEALLQEIDYTPDFFALITQAPIQEAMNQAVMGFMNKGYASLQKEATSCFFDPEGLIKGFSWENSSYLEENPFIKIYKTFFLSENGSEFITGIKMSSPRSEVFVKQGKRTGDSKHMMMYAKTPAQLAEKIDTLQTWAKVYDPAVRFPETWELKPVKYVRPVVDGLINPNADKTEYWFSSEVTGILPTIMKITYGDNFYHENCFGAALFLIGLLSVPRYHEFPDSKYRQEWGAEYIDDEAKNKAIKLSLVGEGFVQLGDMIEIEGTHAFIYLDQDLCINVREPHAPWTIMSTSEAIKYHHQFIERRTEYYGRRQPIDYANLDVSKLPVKTLRMYTMRVGRRSSHCPPMVDRDGSELIVKLTEIIAQKPTHSNIQCLREIFERLIIRLKDDALKDNELWQDLKTVKEKVRSYKI